MKRAIGGDAFVALLLLVNCELSGCSRDAGTGAGNKTVGSNEAGSNASQPAQLKCGDSTYRLSADRIDSEINAACERVETSYEATMSTRAARVRFTCQDSKGHVVSSMLVPADSLDNYNQSCQEFLGAEAALPDSTTDRQAHFAALRKFQTETNQLTRQSVDAANAIWRQNRAAKAALNQLVKARGGAIEITN